VTEDRAEYLTRDLPEMVLCPHCGHIIAWLIEVDGVEVFLPVNMHALKSLRAWYCHACGERYHGEKS
jgi:rubredoxin